MKFKDYLHNNMKIYEMSESQFSGRLKKFVKRVDNLCNYISSQINESIKPYFEDINENNYHRLTFFSKISLPLGRVVHYLMKYTIYVGYQ